MHYFTHISALPRVSYLIQLIEHGLDKIIVNRTVHTIYRDKNKVWENQNQVTFFLPKLINQLALQISRPKTRLTTAFLFEPAGNLIFFAF